MPSYSSTSTMRSGLEAQVNFFNDVTRKSFDSLRKLGELNLHFLQQVMHDSAEASRQLANCSDPFQMAAAAANASQPVVQHLRSYQEQLVGVLSSAQVDLVRGAEAFMPNSAGYPGAMASATVRPPPSSGAATPPGASRGDDADSATAASRAIH